MSKNIIIVLLLIIGFSFDSWGDGFDCNQLKNSTFAFNNSDAKFETVLKTCGQKMIDMHSNLTQRLASLTTLKTQINSIRSANCLAANTILTSTPPIDTELSLLEKSQTTCTQSELKGDLLCSITTSPFAQMGSAVMELLSASLAGNESAKATCDSTGKAAFAAQAAMSAGGAACGVQKTSCMSSCGSAVKSLAKITQSLNNARLAAETASKVVAEPTQAATCSTALTLFEAPLATVQTINAPNTVALGKCTNAFATGLTQIAKTSATLLQQSIQAKACSDQLAGTGTSVEQMCANPTNANSPICKCRTNNTAEGCPGYISKLAGEGNLKALNTGGVSTMGGLTSGSGTGGSGSGIDLGDLSDEAKKILEPPADEPSSNMFAAAGGASAGGLGATSPAGATGGAGSAAEEGSSIGSKFANAVGSAMRGMGFGGGSGGGRPSNSKQQADQYNKIQRKLAAEQFGKEVSTASGLTNFEKINRRYTSNIPTFLNAD